MFPPTKLIDYVFIVTVDGKNPAKTESYFCYPPIASDKGGALQNITPFCFPSATIITPESKPIHSFHDFVLTDEKGQKRFATCWKTSSISIKHPSVAHLKGGTVVDSSAATTTTKPCEEDATSRIHCICLVSNQPRFNSLRACLYELSNRMSRRSLIRGDDGSLIRGDHGSSRDDHGSSPESFLWRLMHEVRERASSISYDNLGHHPILGHCGVTSATDIAWQKHSFVLSSMSSTTSHAGLFPASHVSGAKHSKRGHHIFAYFNGTQSPYRFAVIVPDHSCL